MKEISDGCTLCFPFDTIDELEQEYLADEYSTPVSKWKGFYIHFRVYRDQNEVEFIEKIFIV